MSFSHRRIARSEPNHRQQMALERLEFAVGEIATVLLSSCPSRDSAAAAIRDVRQAVAPIVADILAAE